MPKWRAQKQTERSYSSVLISVKNADKGDQKPFECDLHFNLWKCANNRFMLDCGVMLYDIDYTGQADKTTRSNQSYFMFHNDARKTTFQTSVNC